MYRAARFPLPPLSAETRIFLAFPINRAGTTRRPVIHFPVHPAQIDKRHVSPVFGQVLPARHRSRNRRQLRVGPLLGRHRRAHRRAAHGPRRRVREPEEAETRRVPRRAGVCWTCSTWCCFRRLIFRPVS